MNAFVHRASKPPRARVARRRMLGLSLAVALPAHAATTDLTALSLERLLDVAIVGASKHEQKQRAVAAAVSVITRQEIQTSGWRTLADALVSLPGVHATYDRQCSYVGTRGFGVPGDFDTRLLVADHRIGRDLTLRGSIYEWRMQNIIAFGIDQVSGLTQYQSAETVKARGVALSADKTWQRGARLRGSLSLQSLAYAGGAKPTNAPSVLGKVSFPTPLPVAGLCAGDELQHDSQRRAVDGTDPGGCALSNPYLSTGVLAKGLEASLGICNMFDKRHARPGADNNWQNAFEQDGRSLRVKLSHRV